MNIPASGTFRELWDAVGHDRQQEVPSLPESAIPFFLARLPAPESGRSVVVVLAERTGSSLAALARALQFWQSVSVDARPPTSLSVVVLPLLLPQERAGDIPTPRLRAFWHALAGLRGDEPRLILTTPRELAQPAPSASADIGALVLQEEQTLPPQELAARLLDLGYSEEKSCEEPGTFARRGGILDVFPFHRHAAVRVEYVGNTIDRLVFLQPPARNGTPNGSENAHIETAFSRATETRPRRTSIYPLGFPRRLSSTFGSIIEAAYVIAEDGTVPPRRRVDLVLVPFRQDDEQGRQAGALIEAPAFGGDLERFGRAVRQRTVRKERTYLLTAHPAALRRIAPETAHVSLIPADAAADARGFSDTTEGTHIWTDADIGETPEETLLTWNTGMAYARRFHSGSFVVDRDHGIARFRGIERQTFAEAARDYLILEYAQRDRLFVPVELASKVTAYVGAANPIVHRLGGTEWEATTRAVRAEANDLARELLSLYAARETETGTAYPPDTAADQVLATSFPYTETPDQAAAIREVKRDMERPQPMDRLVCGDVGFGKTEIAIRAAYKAVNFGRQVAVLSPTTLLAQQHYDTFHERLRGTRSRVALLSRFQTPSEEVHTLQALAAGTVDIVIGTHRLLSADVRFKNVGLLIIDEEQKFGVAQKERLKQVRTSVDVLSLSATPIPRTLHMALSGLRALSVIATAPAGRRPVITKVARETDALIRKALEDERDRHGQAYVLWNRVETIEVAAERIRKLVPGARVAVAHGQMPEDELMRVMEKFDTRRVDVLVCSTIIENGIDLPNVNTLVVFDAPSFGLADLYQLRGRVGRGDRQAYAYFLYTQGHLPFEARKRLAALLESVELGSGWTLALRDLEIRGAGNLLGREQHGTIRAVGVHLFGELLSEEVERLRTGKTTTRTEDIQVDLPVKAFIPDVYMPNAESRLAAYTRVSMAKSPDELAVARKDVEALYGQLPPEAERFFDILRVKFLAADAGVTAITENSVHEGVRATPGSPKKERRVTLVLAHGLTPVLAYAAIAENPNWIFTGSSMSISTAELVSASNAAGSADTDARLLAGITRSLRTLAETRRKEASGKAKVPKSPPKK